MQHLNNDIKDAKNKNLSTSSTHSFSKFIGASFSGLCELFIFHPLDSISRRIQNHRGKMIFPTEPRTSITNLIKVSTRGGSLYSGLSIGFFDKMIKRTYKFTTQGMITENTLYPYFLNKQDQHQPKYYQKKAILDALAGAFTGIGEVIFHPIDTIKVNQQIDKNAFQKQNIFNILYQQNVNLYKGAAITAWRNSFGSALLFGSSSAIYPYVFKLKDHRQAAVWQDTTASLIGSLSSVACTLPFDVIKTRLQRACIDPSIRNMTGRSMAKKMFFEEGISSFFKANLTKLTIVSAKLAFGLTAAKRITQLTEKKLYVKQPINLSEENVTQNKNHCFK